MIARGGIVGALGSIWAIICLLPAAAHSSRSGPHRIGVLSPVSSSSATPFVTAMREGLLELGWIEGGNVILDVCYAEGRIERLPGLADGLARPGARVVVAGSNPVVAAAKRATDTIPVVIVTRARLAALASEHRLPAVCWDRSFVSAGGLIFYGAGLPDMYRHAAKYVDRILRGAGPADLPIEQPTKIELVINLQGAEDLTLSLPDSLLARADEVIE